MASAVEPRHAHSRAESEWHQALELEKRLKTTYRKKSFYDPEARSLRGQLRTVYESLLFLDAQFAAANDVEVLLWKSVFYRPIEEFRARLKQADKAGEAGAAQVPKVAAAFLRFLEEASLFYRRLIMQLQAAYGDVGVKLDVPAAAAAPVRQGAGSSGAATATAPGGAAAANGTAAHYSTGSSSAPRNVSPSIHRCLIYLGDLARYTAQAQPKAETAAAAGPGRRPAVEKEWQRARDYYKHAAKVLPRSGNPHNQLAVMAVMEGNALKAVYHYARSLCVGIPFLTARENLLLLFQQNRTSYAELVNRKQQRPQQQQLPIAQLHTELSICYVRLSGLLFDKINQHEYQAVCSSAAAALSAFAGHPALLEYLQRQGRADWQSRADTTPLHLIVLSVFAVQHSTSSGSERRASATEAPGAGAGAAATAGGVVGYGVCDAAQRSLQRSRSLAMVFRTARLLFHAATTAVAALPATEVASAGGTNGVVNAKGTGTAILLMAGHIMLQWLAVHPEFAMCQAAHASDEEVKSRATFWAAAAQLVTALAAAWPSSAAAGGCKLPQSAAAVAAGGVGGVRAAAAAAAGVVRSGSAGGDCDGGALPEELELLGFEPLRSKHHWHVTDVGKHAVDEPATRACRMLAAARMVSASLAADQPRQQQQLHYKTNNAAGAVQPQTLKQLATNVQQFIAAVAAAGAVGSGSTETVATATAQKAGSSQQAHQAGGAVAGVSAAQPTAAGVAAMDVDQVPAVQQQKVPAGDASTQQQQGRQQQQDDDDDDAEEVIVFKPRVVRTSGGNNSSEDGSALPPAVHAAAAAAPALPPPAILQPPQLPAVVVASAAAEPPPLPQQLLAGRSHGRGSGMSSPAAACSSPQRQQQYDVPQPMVASPVASTRQTAAIEVNMTAMEHAPASAAPGAAAAGSRGSSGTSGLLLHGHAATALDLQQAQAASELLLARLGNSRNTQPPLGTSAAAASMGGTGYGAMAGLGPLTGMMTANLPPAAPAGFGSLGTAAGMQGAAVGSMLPRSISGGVAAAAAAGSGGGGFGLQPTVPAVFAAPGAPAAAAVSAFGAGQIGGPGSGSGSFGSSIQQQQQAGFSSLLGGSTAGGSGLWSSDVAAALGGGGSGGLNLNLGFGAGLSQQGAGFEGFDPLGLGLGSAISPKAAAGGGGFNDDLLFGLLTDTVAVTAAAPPGSGSSLRGIGVSGVHGAPAAPIGIAQQQQQQQQASSAAAAYQLEQTAKAAADCILSPENAGVGFAMMQQQRRKQQQQGLAGLLPGNTGSGIMPTVALGGSADLAGAVQQQQQQQQMPYHMQHRRLSGDPISPSAAAIGSGRAALQHQSSLGRVSAPSVLLASEEPATAAAAVPAGVSSAPVLDNSSYAMFAGPNMFAEAVPGSGMQMQMQQQRRVSNASMTGSHSSQHGIAPVGTAAATAAATAAGGLGLELQLGSSSMAAQQGLTLQQQQQPPLQQGDQSLWGADSPTSPEEGGLTLLDYLAKQQQQDRQQQQQHFGSGELGLSGMDHQQSFGLAGNGGQQNALGLGFNGGLGDGGGSGSGPEFFQGGRTGVLLPPLDVVQSQNPFAS